MKQSKQAHFLAVSRKIDTGCISVFQQLQMFTYKLDAILKEFNRPVVFATPSATDKLTTTAFCALHLANYDGEF